MCLSAMAYFALLENNALRERVLRDRTDWIHIVASAVRFKWEPAHTRFWLAVIFDWFCRVALLHRM